MHPSTMSDLALVMQPTPLNPDIGDLEVVNGDVAVTVDARAVLQDIYIRLRFLYGEWFLDRTQGIPYFQRILVSGPDLDKVGAIFRQVILTTPGVAAVDRFATDLDRVNRVLTVTFGGRLTTGSVFTTDDYGAFVVNV